MLKKLFKYLQIQKCIDVILLFSCFLDLESKDVLNMDLDSFLAKVAVPPPKRTGSSLELTSEQINSFIIPPPPPVPPATDIEVSFKGQRGFGFTAKLY